MSTGGQDAQVAAGDWHGYLRPSIVHSQVQLPEVS